jgi:cold shock CspA family protein
VSTTAERACICPKYKKEKTMSTQLQLAGVISYYNSARKYGFIESTVAAPEGGTWIRRYFLAQSQIVFTGVPEIRAGQYVRFEESPRPPKRPDDWPYASRIYIFASEERAKAIDDLTKVGANVGVQKP